MVHADEAKLEKSTFTGCCYALGNSTAATNAVKTHYQKTLNAWTVYFEAVLCAAWETFVEDHQGVQDTLNQLLHNQNKVEFLAQMR